MGDHGIRSLWGMARRGRGGWSGGGGKRLSLCGVWRGGVGEGGMGVEIKVLSLCRVSRGGWGDA